VYLYLHQRHEGEKNWRFEEECKEEKFSLIKQRGMEKITEERASLLVLQNTHCCGLI
jgi:hypothetical protein